MPGNHKVTTKASEAAGTTSNETGAGLDSYVESAGGEVIVLQPGGDVVKVRSLNPNLFGATQKSKSGNNYLLLIALDHYANPGYDLDNPVRDANALLEVLLNRYRFSPKEYKTYTSTTEQEENEAGTFVTLKQKEKQLEKDRYQAKAADFKVFNSERIKCLYNEEVTADTVEQQLNELIAKMQSNDKLLIYFSGHAFRKEDEMGRPLKLTTHTFNPNTKASYFSVDDLTNKGDTERCRNLLLIIDACYSGSAEIGNKHETEKPFSREVLVSCSAAQEASDGAKLIGSPFSRVLVDILQNNVRHNDLRLSTLADALQNNINKIFEGGQQQVSYGKAPTYESGNETYHFSLANYDTPDVKLFAECIINFLNFNIERQYFTEEIDFNAGSKNKDYFILSSVTTNATIERLRGNIISKSFACRLRNVAETSFQLKKFPVQMRWDMTGVTSAEEIFTVLSKKSALPDTFSFQDKIDYFSGDIGRHLERNDIAEQDHNPFCVGFIISNFSPQLHSDTIGTFILQLVKGIEKYKILPDNMGKQWDKLLLYIISVTDENLMDLNCFSEASSKCVFDLFKNENLCEPLFKTFGKIEFIKKPVIMNWLRKTGDAFEASKYQQFRKKQADTQYFPQEDNLSIDKVLYKLADEIEYTEAEKSELFNLLFF